MNYRKVYGGTRVGTESRCDTCTHARIVKGYAESERITICDYRYPPLRVPFRVYQCSDYTDKRLPDFEEMKEIAWNLRTKSAGHQAGFLVTIQTGSTWEQKKEEEDEDEDDEAT
jgi:hypothetical protein